MAAHATQPSMPSISSGAVTIRAPRLRARLSGFAGAIRPRAWEIATASLATVSLAGVFAILAGFDSAAVGIVTATASVATGLVAYLVPLR